MKVEFTFDKEQIQQHGYTVDAVRQTILRGFAAKGLCCVSADDPMTFMALLRTDWFPKFAASCTWYDDDGTQEDVLSQAWKVSG